MISLEEAELGRRDVNLYADFDGRDDPRLPAYLESRTTEQLDALAIDYGFWGRPGQLYKPREELRGTFLIGGRGSGKSFVGRSAIIEFAKHPERCGGRAGIMGRTFTDVEEEMVYGPDGIIAWSPDWLKPKFRGGNKPRLEFPHPSGDGQGLLVRIFTADKPAALHGPNLGFMWCDELRNYRKLESSEGPYRQLFQCVRRRGTGGRARFLITTTPSRRGEVNRLLTSVMEDACAPFCPTCGTRVPFRKPKRVDPRFALAESDPMRGCPSCRRTVYARFRVVTCSTRDNEANNEEGYLDGLLEEFGGTADEKAITEGGLYVARSSKLVTRQNFRRVVVRRPASSSISWEDHVKLALGITAVTVAVDPSGADSEREKKIREEDEDPRAGIVALGRTGDDRPVVLENLSGELDERQWPEAAVRLALRWGSRETYGEGNFGGGMVRRVLQDAQRLEVDPATGRPALLDVVLTTARDSKLARLRPLARLYQQGKVVHVVTGEDDEHLRGIEELEARLCGFDQEQPAKEWRIDDVDAEVHAYRRLFPDGTETPYKRTRRPKADRRALLLRAAARSGGFFKNRT